MNRRSFLSLIALLALAPKLVRFGGEVAQSPTTKADFIVDTKIITEDGSPRILLVVRDRDGDPWNACMCGFSDGNKHKALKYVECQAQRMMESPRVFFTEKVV